MAHVPASATSRESVRAPKVLRAARRGDPGAREQLVASHLGVVRAIAARYRGLGLSFDDLVQEGCIGLLEAIDRYDQRRQSDFEAFARFRIRRAIRNSITEQSRLVRLPKHVVARRRLLALAGAELAAVHGRPPSSEELAAATGLTESAVVEAREAPGEPLPLELMRSGEARVADDQGASDPERETIAADRTTILRTALGRLPARQAEIIRRRFELVDGDSSVSALAGELHLSDRRVRTIEHDALTLLARDLERTLAD